MDYNQSTRAPVAEYNSPPGRSLNFMNSVLSVLIGNFIVYKT